MDLVNPRFSTQINVDAQKVPRNFWIASERPPPLKEETQIIAAIFGGEPP